MRRRTAALAIVFAVLQGVSALGLLVVSVHGPDNVPLAAAIYIACAVAVTWWSARRFDSALVTSGVGLLSLAAAPGLLVSLIALDEWAHDRRVAATRVVDVRDDAIVSASGDPVGVRVSYSVSVPNRGYFGILPHIYSREARTERLRLEAKRWTIDGRSDPTPFEPNRVHTMHVELYPAIVGIVKGQRCLWEGMVHPLPDDVARSPLLVTISETTYGAAHRGGREERTRGDYDLAELYRGVLAEGLPACSTIQPGQ